MLNVLVFNVSLKEGMAGSMRVKRLFAPKMATGEVSLRNLILTDVNEKHKIGEEGVTSGITYKHIGFNVSANLFKMVSFYTAGFAFIKKGRKNAEKNIMYVYGYPDIKNILFILYAKKIGFKILFDIVEDIRFQTEFNGLLGKLRMKSAIYFLNRIPKFGHAVVVISKHLEKRMESICKGVVPIYNIPVVVDLSHIKVGTQAQKTALTIFYGGSFGAKDGLKYLIAAFDNISKKHKNIQFVLTGKPTFEADVDVLNLTNSQVVYKGFLSEEDYYKEVNNADIFCMTRINSAFANAGFPFKLGEFLATGKAVIATNVGDVSDFIEDRKNALLIEPESVSAIETAIEYFIANPAQIYVMGTEARKTALDNFDAEKLSNDLLGYLHKM